MLLLFAACVVAVDQTVTVEQQVDAIVVDVSAGDVTVVAGEDSTVRLSGAFGGAGNGPIDYQVTDGVLDIRYDCQLCGGELKIEAPAEVELTLTLGVGEAGVSYTAAPDFIDVELETGEIDIRVPPGGYVLDLDARRGSVDVDDEIVEDPDSVHSIFAAVTNGSIDLKED